MPLRINLGSTNHGQMELHEFRPPIYAYSPPKLEKISKKSKIQECFPPDRRTKYQHSN
jgi:hypothetical protein